MILWYTYIRTKTAHAFYDGRHKSMCGRLNLVTNAMVERLTHKWNPGTGTAAVNCWICKTAVARAERMKS